MQSVLTTAVIIASWFFATLSLVAGVSPNRKAQSTVPPAFVENVGQAKFSDGRAATYVDATVALPGATAYIHSTGLHIALSRIHVDTSVRSFERTYDVEEFRVDMRLIGSNPSPRLERLQPTPGHVRYILPGMGANGAKASLHSTLLYRDVWPGIDLRMYLTLQGVKYDFVVHPGADPRRIAFVYDGGKQPTMHENGDFSIATPLGTIGERAPYVITAPSNGSRGTVIPSSFDVSGQSVRFDIGEYDNTTTLIVDPQRVWATYYGFNQSIDEFRSAIDPQGNVIIAGSTTATNMPSVPGVLQRRNRGNVDGFVSKFNEFGTFLWHTHYGGSLNDKLFDVTTDAKGVIWACGQSNSKDLPNIELGSNAYPVDSVQGSDGVVLSLDANGAWSDSWQYSGREADVLTGIAVSNNRIAVVGYTRSPAFGGNTGNAPWKKTAGTFNNTDIFVSVVKPKTTPANRWQNDYLVFYGSDEQEVSGRIAFDPQGNVVFTGLTQNAAFPVTDGTTFKAIEDPVVVKFNPTAGRVWATMFGTSNLDDVNDIAIDSTGAVIVVGETLGNDFPTVAPYKATRTGFTDGFIRKYTAAGAVAWSTYYGGDSLDGLNGVAIDKNNNIWVAGYTRSTNPPISNDAFQKTLNVVGGGLDGLIGQMNPGGTAVLYGSYYGAPSQDNPPVPPVGGPAPPPNTDFGSDVLSDVSVEKNAYVVFLGRVNSYRMTTTPGAYQDSSALAKDTLRFNGFVSYFSNCRDSVVTIQPNGPSTLCDVDSRQLVGPAGFASYLWSTGVTTRNINVTQAGTYWVVCTTADGCRYRDTIVISSNPKPSVRAGNDTTGCINTLILLGANGSGGTPPYKYKWRRLGAGLPAIDNDSVRTPNVNPSGNTDYEVTLTDAAGCSSKDTIKVTIVNPKPVTGPALVDFGNLDACTSAGEADITIENPGPQEIRITTFTPDDPRVSLVTSLAAPIIIPPLDGKTLRVRVAPATSGTINGSFTLGGLPCNWVAKYTYRVTKAEVKATAIPGTVSFGADVRCNQTAKRDSTVIRNNGNDVITLLPGATSAPFTIVSPTAATTLQPNAQQVVVFQYDPTTTGTFTEVAKFPYTAGTCSDTLRVNLNAISSDVTVNLSWTDLDIGTLNGCETERDTVLTIENTSPVEVSFTFPPSGSDVVFNPGGTIRIPAKSSVTSTCTVRPPAPGNFDVTGKATVQPCNVSIDMRVRAVKNGLAFSTPSSIDFGELSGCSPSKSVTQKGYVTFEGTGTASVVSVTTSTAITTTLSNNQALAPGQRIEFDVTWTPSADGVLSDSIVIEFQPCAVRQVIRLSGVRTTPSIRAENAAIALGAVPGNATGTTRFINDGTDTLFVTVVSRTPNTFIMDSRPSGIVELLPGAVIEVDYRVNCGGRATIADTIEATVARPCALVATTSFTGTCETTRPASSTIAIDSVAVKTGDIFTVPVRITSSDGLNANNLRAWTAKVTYNPTVVVGSGTGTPDCYQAGQLTPCTIDIAGTRGTDSLGVIYTLNFTAVLGTADMTMLTLTDFAWTGSPTTTVTARDGKVMITDICQAGGDRYLRPEREGFGISVFPIPASTDLTIAVRGAGTAPATWTLSNYVGVEVASGTITPDASGVGQSVVNVRTLGSGLYLLTTQALGSTFKNSIVIQR
jgi:hypothetical protein